MQLAMLSAACSLAHVASHEGIAAVEHIAGQNRTDRLYEGFPMYLHQVLKQQVRLDGNRGERARVMT